MMTIVVYDLTSHVGVPMRHHNSCSIKLFLIYRRLMHWVDLKSAVDVALCHQQHSNWRSFSRIVHTEARSILENEDTQPWLQRRVRRFTTRSIIEPGSILQFFAPTVLPRAEFIFWHCLHQVNLATDGEEFDGLYCPHPKGLCRSNVHCAKGDTKSPATR